MSNIRTFPGRGTPKKGRGPSFQVTGPDGKLVDVLAQVVHAGGVFLIPMQEGVPEELPVAQFLRTLSSFDALTEAENALITHARDHSDRHGEDGVLSLVQFGRDAQKVMRRLIESVPTNQVVLTTESYGPEFLVEYATTAAMTIACDYALKILDLYGRLFIQTGQDKRKSMFTDFQLGYQEAKNECDSLLKDQESVIKDVISTHRALQKLLKNV